MSSPTQKNVIRYTLQSYLGKDIKGITLGERQQEAVTRLSQLSDVKFDELCSDTINEVHRRTGVNYDAENKMQSRFSKLNDEKFKSLILDILTVFYTRNPTYKIEDFPEFVGSVKQLIDQLKIDAEKTQFLKRIETQNFYDKIHNYAELTKNNATAEEFPNQTVGFFEFLSFPKIFIDQISKTEIQNETLCQKIEECRKRIVSVFSDSEVDSEAKSIMIKYDISQIIGILLNQITIEAISIGCFDHEIKVIIEILDSLTLDVMRSDQLNLNLFEEKLVNVIDKISLKATGRTPQNSLYKVNLKKIPLESLCDQPSRLDSFELIIDVIREMREFFKCIAS